MSDIRRTQEMTDRYSHERESMPDYAQVHHFDPSVDSVIREFEHWYIIENNFPYDRITNTHHILAPKRVFGRFEDATQIEQDDYRSILKTLECEQFYDSLQINFSKDRSVCAHYHVHLIVWKRITEEVHSDPENG